MRNPTYLAALCAVALLSATAPAAPAQAAPAPSARPSAAPAQAAPTGGAAWAGAWGYAPADSDVGEPVQPAGTYPQRVRLTQAGDAIQLTFSNAEGYRPLRIVAAGIASPSGPVGTEIGANPVHAVRFSGQPAAALPKGHTLVSDPITAPFRNGQDVIVTVTFSTPTRPGRTNLGLEMAFAPLSTGTLVVGPIQARSWLSLVSVRAAQAPCTVVAFGDSITDGFDSFSPQTRGWPGRLAERMAALAPGRRCGVVNMGISGNRVLQEGRARSNRTT